MTPADTTGEGLTIMIGGKVVQTIPLISPQPGRTVVRYHMVEIVHESTPATLRYAVERLDGHQWALVSDHGKLSVAAAAFEAAQESANCALRLFDRQSQRALDEVDTPTPHEMPPQKATPYAIGLRAGAPDERLMPALTTEAELLDALMSDTTVSSGFDRIEIRAADGSVLHELK